MNTTTRTIFFSTLIVAVFSQTYDCNDLSERLNELVGSRTKNLSAWDINVSHGQWLYPDPDTYVPNEIWSSCGEGNKWYGWSGSPGNEVENIGSISTILPVSGKIRLGFGNCWNSGNVILSLNGVLKSSARNNSQHVSTFKFEAGDKLMLSDEGHNSIIQFNFINLTNCSPSTTPIITTTTTITTTTPTTITTTTPTIIPTTECPSNGWFHVTDVGCFHFGIEAEEVSWFEAEQYCKNLESGAWLAEIPNDVTQALLQGYNIHNQEWWIGANDLWMEGSWNWERNSSPLTYTNWQNGQPNNQNGHQDCLAFLFDGHWNDQDCNLKLRPICQKFEI